jgi:serine/threonine protein phosphatase PrpC
MHNPATATHVAVPPGDGYVGHVGSSPTNEVIRPDAAELGVVEHAALSDLGREREGNEDSFLERPPLFVVADGMGGAEAGEVASGTVVEVFEAAADAGELPDALEATVQTANGRIHAMATDDTSKAGMGCTTTAAYAAGGQLTVAHVGDSRLYRLRDGSFDQLTDDHSLVGGLVRLGQLTPEEAEHHPQRSVILRAVGVEPTVEVDILHHELEPGDVYLVCSDGLTGMVRDVVIVETLGMFSSLAESAEMLIELANAAGGRDNITVALFRIGTA